MSPLSISGSISFHFPKLLKNDLRRNIDNEPSMDVRVYFLLFPSAFNGDLKRNIDYKSSMDLVVYFPKPSNRYLRRNIDNKSSLDRRVYFLLFP